MKRKMYITFASIIFSLMCILTMVEKSEAMKIYDFKNAKIIQETNVMGNMTRIEYDVGNWGNDVREKTTTEINAFGMKQKQEQINFIKRTPHKILVYNYNPETNEASEMDMSGAMGGKMGEMQEFSEESLEKFGGKVLRKEKYQGLLCTVVEYVNFNSIVYYFKKFSVKSIVKMGGMEIITELVSFEEGAAKDYELPSDAKITQKQNIDDVMKKLKASQNVPEYEEDQEQMDSGYDPEVNEIDSEDSTDIENQMEEAMEAISGMLGNE